jgi:hypothetical protein
MNIQEMARKSREFILSEQAKSDNFSLEWAEGVNLQEMITSDQGSQEFIDQVSYDLFDGAESVELVYKQFYNTITDANLPEIVPLRGADEIQVVFLQHVEGGEVQFGAMAPGERKTVEILTWASGLQFTEEFVLYNKTWEISENSRALGRAHSILRNHLGLGPIVLGTYTTTGGGLAAQVAAQKNGTAQLVAYSTSTQVSLKNGLRVLPKANKVLVNSFDYETVLEAIASDVFAQNSSLKGSLARRITADQVVVYDGEEITVGKRTFTYGGVPIGFAFLAVAKSQNFREFVKHELLVDSDDNDLSRLVLDQTVARARLGIYAGIGGVDGAVKVDITA